jgi:hypothetical protein
LRDFDTLGDDITRAWESAHCEEAAFTDIAASLLQRSGVLESTSLGDITKWFFAPHALPSQALDSFGQPTLRVYQGRGFRIELLFWVDVPTAIHQHTAAGAFGVLRGSSFHSEYEFTRAQRVCDEIQIGTLSLVSAELLQRGAVRPIRAGRSFVHSLLHLEPPSISVVVRSTSRPTDLPQWRYMLPGLAVDPFYTEQPLMTQLELLKTLQRAQPSLFYQIALDIVAQRDFYFAYRVVEKAYQMGGNCAGVDELFRALALRHAEFAAMLEAALREERRASSISRHLTHVTNPEHRVLLALLINAPNRGVVDQAMQACFPGHEPEAKLLALIGEMSQNDEPVFGFDNLSLRLLQFAMRGADLAAVEDVFERRFGTGHRALAPLRERWQAIHSESVLAPLLCPPRPAAATGDRELVASR